MIWAIASMFISCFKFYVWTYLWGKKLLGLFTSKIFLFLVKKKSWMYLKHERYINKVKIKTNITWLIILAAIGPWPWPSEIVWKCDLVTPNETKEKLPRRRKGTNLQSGRQVWGTLSKSRHNDTFFTPPPSLNKVGSRRSNTLWILCICWLRV